MLHFSENRPSRRSSEDKVVFKNVEKCYKFPSSVMVEYILSPKVKTSSKDYVGIYPRDWKNLKQFVGFEFAKHLPCDEPNLYRCLEITCKPPGFNAAFNRDYQFVYVDQLQEVLGRSSYFQFVEECDIDQDAWKEGETPDWWQSNESNWQDACPPPQNIGVEDNSLEISPFEVAYNQCFFHNGQEHASRFKDYPETVDVACGGADVVSSNGCFMPPKEESNQKRRGRRALVKTSSFVNEFRSGHHSPAPRDLKLSSPASLDLANRTFPPITRDQSVNTSPVHGQNLNWYQSQHVPVLPAIPDPNRSDIRSGAIPKHCHKCRAPSDYHYKEQLTQHELVQAYEQIRDLKNNLDVVHTELQLSQAANSKLKVLNSIIMRERDEAKYVTRDQILTMANNLAVTVLNSFKIKVPTDNNNLVMVSQEPVAQGVMIHRGPNNFVVPGRPVIRVVRGRDKVLKAIIGHQEEKIRNLRAQLCDALKAIQPSNLENLLASPNMIETEKEEVMVMNSPPMTPRQIMEKNSDLCFNNVDQISKLADCDETPKVSSEVTLPGEEANAVGGTSEIHDLDKESEPWEDALVVEPKFYHLDAMQTLNCEVVLDEDQTRVHFENEEQISCLEANNNNYDTKNMNPDCDAKCAVCEPALQCHAGHTQHHM